LRSLLTSLSFHLMHEYDIVNKHWSISESPCSFKMEQGAAFVNRILQRDTVVQHDGPSIAKVQPYPRFYNYDPKQNRRSIINRNPYIPREKAS